MTRTDRLTGIILALQGGRQTAARLAARFEVSRRTVLRDMDALSQIGVPVIALPGAGGGFALAEGYRLPPLHFSAPEAAALLLALGGLGEAAASPFGEARGSAEAKLRAVLRPSVLAEAERALDDIGIEPPPAPTDAGHLRALHDAVRRRRWVRVEYASLRRVAAHLLLPLRLSAAAGRWYCIAVSHKAREERRYRVDRVVTLAPASPPPDAEAALAAAARPRRAYADPAHPEVVLRLSYPGVRLAEDAFSWAGPAEPVGPGMWELRFRCPPAELRYYAREVHALGPSAEVLAPPALRALVLERAAATVGVYADAGSTEPAAEW